MECPWHVLQGDVIGLHTIPGSQNGIRLCIKTQQGNTGACAYGSYGSFSRNDTLTDDALIEGYNYSLKKTSRSRISAIQALYH